MAAVSDMGRAFSGNGYGDADAGLISGRMDGVCLDEQLAVENFSSVSHAQEPQSIGLRRNVVAAAASVVTDAQVDHVVRNFVIKIDTGCRTMLHGIVNCFLRDPEQLDGDRLGCFRHDFTAGQGAVDVVDQFRLAGEFRQSPLQSEVFNDCGCQSAGDSPGPDVGIGHHLPKLRQSFCSYIVQVTNLLLQHLYKAADPSQLLAKVIVNILADALLLALADFQCPLFQLFL